MQADDQLTALLHNMVLNCTHLAAAYGEHDYKEQIRRLDSILVNCKDSITIVHGRLKAHGLAVDTVQHMAEFEDL